MMESAVVGVVGVTCPNFATNHIFGIREARHLKYRVLTDTQECC